MRQLNCPQVISSDQIKSLFKVTLKILDYASSDAIKNIQSSFQKGLYTGTISIIIH